MFKKKDTEEVLMSGFSHKEIEIINELGYCGKTKKLLQIYCFDCKILISVESFISEHSKHSVIENDKKNAKTIFKDIVPIIEAKQTYRLENLNEKIFKMSSNLKDLEMKRSASKILKSVEIQIKNVADKIYTCNYQKIENWIDKLESESNTYMSKLRQRIEQASGEFEDFLNSVEEFKSMNPVVNNYLLMSFSSVLDKKCENDKKFKIHDVPFTVEYSKKLYGRLFSELTCCLLENLIGTLSALGAESDKITIKQEFFEHLERTFEDKNQIFYLKRPENYQKVEFINLSQYKVEELKFENQKISRTEKILEKTEKSINLGQEKKVDSDTSFKSVENSPNEPKEAVDNPEIINTDVNPFNPNNQAIDPKTISNPFCQNFKPIEKNSIFPSSGNQNFKAGRGRGFNKNK